MSTDQPSPFNLEHLKKTAKRLLRACRALDMNAVSSIQATLPRLRNLPPSAVADSITLADVHQALALDRGFRSWGDLIRLGDPLSRLLTAVRGGHGATLQKNLHNLSGLATSNIFAAAAIGNARALRQHLAHDSALATAEHDDWTPLDYVCASPLARFSPRHATSLCDCAELLIAAGADPNRAVADGRTSKAPLPATMRAMASNNLSLVAILKKSGAAEPREMVQQWMDAPLDTHVATLRQFFSEYFRRPETKERMKRAIEESRASESHERIPSDLRDIAQQQRPQLLDARLHLWSALLENGFDPTSVGPTGRSPLHALVTYAPASFLEPFLQRGGNANVRDAEGRSLLATAVRAGNIAAADVLRKHGIEDDSTPMDRLIGLCVKGDAEAAQDLVADYPDLLLAVTRNDADEFVRAAARGRIDQVRLMLACGFPPDAMDDTGATALHQAAWRGQVPIVELLLARGASPSTRDDVYGETALEWAQHGASHAEGAQGPCLEAARLIQDSISR
jgi:ankyrin repeat protein